VAPSPTPSLLTRDEESRETRLCCAGPELLVPASPLARGVRVAERVEGVGVLAAVVARGGGEGGGGGVGAASRPSL
jgi:hypothetical protein